MAPGIYGDERRQESVMGVGDRRDGDHFAPHG